MNSRVDFNYMCNVNDRIMLRLICFSVIFPFSNRLNEVCDDLLCAIMSAATVFFLRTIRRHDIYLLVKINQTIIKNKTSYKDIYGER